MKVYEGKILTVDARDSVKKYLVEDNGKILFVGDELPDIYASAPKEQVAALCPAFADTHQHFASFSLFNSGLNCMEARSNREILKMCEDYVKSCKSKLLIAFGASPYSVEEQRLITREELDSVSDNRPFFMVKYDGHACIVNSALLKKIDAKVRSLRGYHPDTGEMNQEAFFAVSDYITNSVSIPDLIRCMKKAVADEIACGIGMVHTVSGVGFPLNLDITTEMLFGKCLKNGFQLRVFPQSMNTRVATSRGLKRIGGCFACALDGCFGSQDAAMILPYADNAANSGVLYYSDAQVTDFCKKANRLGLQIELHAIGDRAFEQACEAIKAALDDFPRADHRHGIIHACLPTQHGLDICEKYRIQVPMQIAFDNWAQEPASYTSRLLGAERNSRLNPIKSFADCGCFVSFGSDAPCTTPNPMVWLDKAVNHSNPDQAVTVQQALRMCTFNGYRATFDEAERGSLEVGKYADMCILSDDPYEMPHDELNRLKVLKTVLKGKAIE